MHTSLHILSTALLCAQVVYTAAPELHNNGLTITLTPSWQEIGHGKAAANNFGGAWICAGTITIKKRVNETLALTQAAFRWHGAPLTSLHASLYRKNSEPFLAIEENLVSDGVWKHGQQQLSFSFSHKQILDPITTFYLVLTVPSQLEQPLKKGGFELLTAHLPAQIQSHLAPKTLMLALSDLAVQKGSAHTRIKNTKLAQARR